MAHTKFALKIPSTDGGKILPGLAAFPKVFAEVLKAYELLDAAIQALIDYIEVGEYGDPKNSHAVISVKVAFEKGPWEEKSVPRTFAVPAEDPQEAGGLFRYLISGMLGERAEESRSQVAIYERLSSNMK